MRAAHGVGGVYKGKTFFSPSHPEAENDNQKTGDDLLEDLLTGTSGAPTSIVTSFPHWSVQWIGHPTTHRTCAAARDLSDQMWLDASFYAALEVGHVYALTLHLSDAEEAKARAADDAADRIYRRICRRLGEVQNAVLFAVAMEDRTSEKKHVLAFDRAGNLERRKKALAKLLRDDRRIHVHGLIVIADHEMEDVKKALKLAGGVGYDGKRQLMLKPAHSVGWASYMMKNAHFSSPNLRPYLAGSRLAPRFNGDVMKISGPLRRLAKAHYEAFRADQKAKNARKPPPSRASRKTSFRWPTDVRTMLGSTTMTPLTLHAPVMSTSNSSITAPGALLSTGRALWRPSSASITLIVAPAHPRARRRTQTAARRAVQHRPAPSVRRAA